MSSGCSSENQSCCCNQVMEEVTSIKKDLRKYFQYFIKHVEFFKEILETNNILKQQHGNQLRSSNKSKNVQRESTQTATRCVKRRGQINATGKQVAKKEMDSPEDEKLYEIEKLKLLPRPKVLQVTTVSTDEEYLQSSSEGECCPSDQLNEEARVLPIRPFQSVVEFEDWNDSLENSEILRIRLHDELMEGQFINANYYIRNIWKCIFVDEVAECFSLHGNVKTNKKALKDYIFTNIFQDCFEERFPDVDTSMFMKRTIYLFNYVTDRARRVAHNLGPEVSMEIEFV